MKKLFAVLFISVVMAFAFAGCTDAPDNLPPENGGNQTENLPVQPEENDKKEITEMYLTVNGNKLTVTLAKNSSVDALVEILKQGDITYTADDYGGFEKVGNLGHSLPRNDTQISTQAGDVILYQGNSLCLYYGENSWNFTRIGKINGYSVSELKTLLGAGKGSVQVTISLK